ncbi:glycosyltransferase [Rhodanobacter sp. FDAARGOS 1247]|nr:glycosyltransferase [Rhodanobacter sp. FDAARGOS 1247]
MWAQSPITTRTGYRVREKDIPFPNAIPHEMWKRVKSDGVGQTGALVCVCRLDDYKQKGILELLDGLALAIRSNGQLTLDLIGPACAVVESRIRIFIEERGLKGRVRLLGSVPRNDICAILTRYEGLVMISTSESFGLVFAEAILAGIPVIYLAGSGIDGHAFAKFSGIRCLGRDRGSVADAIGKFFDRKEELRANLAEARENGGLDSLTSKGQSRNYISIINNLVSR